MAQGKILQAIPTAQELDFVTIGDFTQPNLGIFNSQFENTILNRTNTFNKNFTVPEGKTWYINKLISSNSQTMPLTSVDLGTRSFSFITRTGPVDLDIPIVISGGSITYNGAYSEVSGYVIENGVAYDIQDGIYISSGSTVALETKWRGGIQWADTTSVPDLSTNINFGFSANIGGALIYELDN